ncbi:alpha/beta hydrolase [Chitiniphilus purpureus]|uniref:Alpha/beta hydrolase n=1 Tax=Chitiniphilus purpureus TaxID=2981137 RepID=A0ABY6DRS6_9NEIS|nr:alpha/beta hydrolase [Chitiniphilus sp. CD1]UXY14608.1 alpha/beta hydrolase [Chitiniphilus sp. CD1]
MNDVIDLEVLHRPADAARRRAAPPLLFVHGAYAGAWCWEETFLPYFARLGYDCHALSLAGHGGSEGRDRLDNFTLNDFLDNVASVAGALPAAPVLIGHSLGGYLVQRHARRSQVAGLALLASVPPYGLSGSLAYVGLTGPHLLAGLSRFQWHEAPDRIDLRVLRELLFSTTLPQARLDAFAARAQPESTLALAELMLPQPWQMFGLPRPLPCLVVGAGQDRIISPADVVATARAWGVPAQFCPQIGHALTVDDGWEQVAGMVADWLARHFGGKR